MREGGDLLLLRLETEGMRNLELGGVAGKYLELVNLESSSPMKSTIVSPLLAGVFLAVFSASSLPVAASSVSDLATRIEERLNDPELAESHWGVLIESIDSGEIWYERNADRLFVPASNQKILVSAAAYRALGPDFTFTTTVRHTGQIAATKPRERRSPGGGIRRIATATGPGEGVLQGDLVVVGNGDPTIYNRFFSHPHDVFKKWAQELKDLGIHRIAGDIIGDDDAWEDQHVGRGWPQNEITPWYYAEYGPLTFNENYVDLRFIPPASVDEELVIEPNVESSYFTLINNVEVVESGRNRISMDRPMFSNTITLSGTVVAGSRPFGETPTITNPTLFYVTALKEVLEAEGIVVEGQPVDCDDISDWEERGQDLPVLITHLSPPLREIIPPFMKRSQNMNAENLVHTMGWHEEGFGSFNGGRRVIERELAAFGIEAERFRFSDGSGLSRYNHVTPRQIVAINRGMYESDLRDLWLESQAVAGVDGTLRRISSDSLLANNVRGKTGTLSSVRSLSGFITTASGEKLLFSILNNGSLRGSSAVDAVSHAVLEMVAAFEGE